MNVKPRRLSKEDPSIREIRKLARKAEEIQVYRTSVTDPGYWDVWADQGDGLEPVAQWPTAAIDELAARHPEVWDADSGPWILKAND